ncbi:MAG: nitroreductase family protein [Anaerolineae bacterium]|nr:nitroreductase family protein [Anaerolineae bacterium]
MRLRRSIRRYTDQAVPRDVLERLLEAARWGPSAHNRQPWRFAVITDPARRAALAQAMGKRFRRDLQADGLPPEAIAQQVQRSIDRISTAPAILLVFVSMADMDQYPDEHRQTAERTMAVQSVALAAQNVLLLAHAEGLGACWLCAPLFCPDVVRAELGLPADWEAQALITIGYPAEDHIRDREPIETKTKWF